MKSKIMTFLGIVMSYLKFIVQSIYKVSTIYIIDRVKSRARAAEAIAVQPNKK